MYFEIYFGEDGASIQRVPKENLEKSLSEGGGTVVCEKMSEDAKSFKTLYGDDGDYLYKSIIIKGEVVIPKQVVKVTKYEIN